MADSERKLSNGGNRIDFVTEPSRYRHWKLATDGETATLTMDVDENAPLFEGYQLKLNSYDLGVDIEIIDHLPHQNQLLVILLPKEREIRLYDVKQFGHHNRHTVKMTRTGLAT